MTANSWIYEDQPEYWKAHFARSHLVSFAIQGMRKGAGLVEIHEMRNCLMGVHGCSFPLVRPSPSAAKVMILSFHGNKRYQHEAIGRGP
jgi:hypothetical protein